MVIVEEEAEIIRYMFDEFIAGRQIQDIHNELNEKGITYRGKPFIRRTVYGFITNEKYAGIYRHDGIIYENTYSPIVSKKKFDIVKARLDFNRFGKHKRDVVYLLRNKVVCGYCSQKVSGAGTARSGEVKRYYKCRNRRTEHCVLVSVRKDVFEKLVIDTILEALDKADAIENVASLILETNAKRIENSTVL